MMIPALVLMIGLAVDDAAPTIADLEGYRLALRPGPSAPGPVVGFRDLWDHPGTYAGARVRVEGRLARLFRQPAIGEFPALAEAWVVSPGGDPFCLVYPDREPDGTPEVGSAVRFAGTFLRRVRYRGEDVPRLAPLIVGPAPPGPGPAPDPTAWPGSAWDWAIGIGAAAVVAAILGARHLDRPPSRPAVTGPAPAFLDGGSSPDPGANGANHDFA